jgi:hypothetical protein
MASTYTLIASNTLGSSAASVTFSAIPATFTDLVLRTSIRGTAANNNDSVSLNINNGAGYTLYSKTFIQGNGATVSTNRASADGTLNVGLQSNGGNNTANSFTSMEVYIPNYASTTNKPISAINAMEQNSTTAYITAGAFLSRLTAATDSLTITNGSNLAAGSSFFLYGIKNS